MWSRRWSACSGWRWRRSTSSSPRSPSLPKPSGRHQARELALKVLFQLENKPEDEPQAALDYHASEEGAAPEVKEFARTLVDGVLTNRERLDSLISEASSHWRLDQMGKVDRAVLRIAVYEIAIDRGVPVKAAINESIELAKTFSGEESGRFVNGVLGKVAAGAE